MLRGMLAHEKRPENCSDKNMSINLRRGMRRTVLPYLYVIEVAVNARVVSTGTQTGPARRSILLVTIGIGRNAPLQLRQTVTR